MPTRRAAGRVPDQPRGGVRAARRRTGRVAPDRRRHRPDGPDHRRDRRAARARPRHLGASTSCAASRVETDALVIGALTTYTEIRRSALVAEHLPALVEAAATIGAAQIQNRGTIGGNVVNASPAGDTLPVLLAMRRGDRARLRRAASGPSPPTTSGPPIATTARARRRAAAARPDPAAAGRQVRFRKVGTRRAQAISKVVMALAWRARTAASGATSAWRSDRWPRRRSERRRPRPSWRAPRRRARPPTRAAAALAAEIAADRRRPLDRRLPARGRRPRPAPAHSRRRRLVRSGCSGPASRSASRSTVFPSAADFRTWLDANHAAAPELFVGYYRKGSGSRR